MRIKDTRIKKESIWIRSTPVEFAQNLPFYMIEAGLFYSSNRYFIERDGNTGYLLFYTVKKSGKIEQNQHEFILSENHAAIIDCSKPHKYYASEEGWDFIWIWFDGKGVKQLFDLLYPEKMDAIDLSGKNELKIGFMDLLQENSGNDVKKYIATSRDLHHLINEMIYAALERESDVQKKDYSKNIEEVIQLIQTRYSEQITLDDMIDDIHISKYHFIRLFRRVMGVTPYHYLTTYRINEAKKLLCTTDKSISEIAFQSGFQDVSQFIRHFKKYVGMRPLQYRTYFKQY